MKPPHVTPHYWTAGEILALQVEMLAYVDESGREPVLVIGGGVPKPWVGKPMRVRRAADERGPGGLELEGREDAGYGPRPRPKIRVGPAFGATVRVE